MADVQLSGLRKIYGGARGDHVAVHNIDLHVADGEFVVLVGPSGCGKSTILRMIAGLEVISDGELSIGGTRVNDLAPGERDIAMVFQTYALYPHMTVYENLAFALKLRGMPAAALQARVQAAAAAMHIESLLQRRPRALSGGERQRVALGRALVREPKVFLFDEPLSNLDARLRVQMRREIARLHRELGATMIYVTHDQVEAMTLGDRIVVLRDGRVQQVDTPKALYEQPENVFVAGFIGSPAMNIIPGKVVADGDALTFADGDFARMTVPPQWRNALMQKVGQPLLLGVRPEHLTITAPSLHADSTHLIMRVDLVENLGNEAIVHGSENGREITVRVGPSALPEAGARTGLYADPEHLHFFDAGTQQRIDNRV
ncbi:MAG: sn-glycerol-3-phosphate ABC transporter ATP-binding protein UgpC [Gemmatimonadota bacterium]|nr:sn-glycerol-3-phosphate ABC transporter ATP-binding protein UgpC [Gemmatimonadota bacterium]